MGRDRYQESSYFKRRVGRRDILRAGLVAIAGVALGAISYEYLMQERETLEQQKAARILKNARYGEYIENISLNKDLFEYVNLRNKPGVPYGEDDDRAGSDIGNLEDDSLIVRAIPVIGNDPSNSRDRNRTSVWYAFFDCGTGCVWRVLRNAYNSRRSADTYRRRSARRAA